MSSKIKSYNVSLRHACSYYPHFPQEEKKKKKTGPRRLRILPRVKEIVSVRAGIQAHVISHLSPGC